MNPANYSTINANSDKLGGDRIFGFSSFTKSENGISIFSTTSYEGNRNPYSSGIFLPKIPFNNGASLLGLIHSSEFGARLISRDKPSNRTNKASHSYVVVETLPHPIKGGNSLLTSYETNTMKTPTQQANTAQNPTITPSLSENSGFTSGQISAKFRTTVLNQTAERGNSNNLHMANNSTPLQQRAFFVRSPNSPQRNHLNNADFLSMVAFGGQGIALDCFPYVTVFPPRQTLSPNTVESVAIASNNQHMEQIAMIYQFLCVNRNTKPYLEEVVQVQAINEDEARWQLTAEHALLATVGRYPDHQTQQATDRTARLNARLLAKFRPNLTACEVVYA